MGPDDIWYAQKKGKGKGKRGGGGGEGKGRRSGCREKPEKRLWIGNLPVIEDRDKRIEAEQKLKELLQQGGECKFATICPKGTGIATFPSAEEVQAAIQALAGTKFRGKVLEFDTWTNKE